MINCHPVALPTDYNDLIKTIFLCIFGSGLTGIIFTIIFYDKLKPFYENYISARFTNDPIRPQIGQTQSIEDGFENIPLTSMEVMK